MFIIVLSTRAMTWNKARCPSMVEWINVLHTYHGILCSYQKELNCVLGSNMDYLEAIILNELMQKEKIKYCTFSIIHGS